MAECKFMRQNDDEKYCTMFLAKCDSKELEFCCDDNCTVRDMAEENERLKEENVKLLFDKGTLLEFCNKLTQIIDKKKENENKLLQTLQEIKKVHQWILDQWELDTKEVQDKILDLITKAESEG